MSAGGVPERTARRLAFASGNRCAFPGCGSPLWVAEHDLLLGEMCHIKGAKPKAKRHDRSQTDEERHGFDNLILLCRNHHVEVDNDDGAFTVEKLLTMKRAHEARVLANGEASAPPETVARRLADVVGGAAVTGERSVVSINQMGGQTAHSIVNQGPQPRGVSSAAGEALVAALRRHPPEQYQLSYMMEAESAELGEVLAELLERGGWQQKLLVPGATTSGGPPRGVVVETSVDTPAIDALTGWLEKAGLEPQVNRGTERFRVLKMEFMTGPVPVHVVVGVLPR